MTVSIRLQRRGKIHKPFYHVVVADKRRARNGKFIEKIGYYDPNQEPSQIVMNAEKTQEWYAKGAELSPTVKKLAKIQNIELTRAKTQ